MKKRLIAILLSALLVFCAGAMCVFAAEDAGDHGIDAHSESMSVGPDGTSEGALETPEGYEDRNITDEESEEALSGDTSSTGTKNSSNEDRKKEEKSMDSRILVAMIAAGVTIVVCEYITKKIKK